MSTRVKKPVYMRVWEDEEIKEQNLSILKKTIEEEKNFSELKINPLKKSLNSSKFNTIEQSKRFEKWFETNSKWHQTRQHQKQVLFEFKQNEKEQSFLSLKKKYSSVESNKISNRSFIERLSETISERKLNLKKLESELSPCFKAKTNNRLPSYINRSLQNSFSLKVQELKSEYKSELINRNQTNYYSHNAKKSSTLDKNKTLNKSYSSNNFNFLTLEKEKKKFQIWENMIHNVNSNNKSNDEKLYKINVRDSSAWDKEKESNVYFDPKLSTRLLISLAHKKIVNMENLYPTKNFKTFKSNINLTAYMSKKEYFNSS